MSTLSVTTINTANSTTDLTLKTGNTSGPSLVVDSTGNFSFTNGNIGIGNTAPALDLYLNGSAAAAIGTLTDSANIAVDMSTYNNFSVTLSGNRNIDNPSGLQPGQAGVIFLVQDATGTRTLSWSSYWKFESNTAPTLSTVGNSIDMIQYVVRTSTHIVVQEILDVG